MFAVIVLKKESVCRMSERHGIMIQLNCTEKPSADHVLYWNDLTDSIRDDALVFVGEERFFNKINCTNLQMTQNLCKKLESSHSVVGGLTIKMEFREVSIVLNHPEKIRAAYLLLYSSHMNDGPWSGPRAKQSGHPEYIDYPWTELLPPESIWCILTHHYDSWAHSMPSELVWCPWANLELF